MRDGFSFFRKLETFLKIHARHTAAAAAAIDRNGIPFKMYARTAESYKSQKCNGVSFNKQTSVTHTDGRVVDES